MFPAVEIERTRLQTIIYAWRLMPRRVKVEVLPDDGFTVFESADSKIARGVCPNCSDPLPKGRRVCWECRSKSARMAVRLADERREAGLCVRCGLFPPDAGRVHCTRCLAVAREKNKRGIARRGKPSRETVREYNARLYARRLADGQCRTCGKPNPDTRFKTCPVCREEARVRVAKSKAARRAATA